MSKLNKVAIVQPYVFPYIGYFQLINSVEIFVFYDDVNFIKKGWVNRNNLLVNKMPSLFTIPLVKPSQNKLINEIDLSIDEKWISAFLNKLTHSYCKAPYFEIIAPLVEGIIRTKKKTIAELSIVSVMDVAKYMELEIKFKISSQEFSESKGMDRSNRLIKITKELGSSTYINPYGGKELYTKDYFLKNDIDLYFLKPQLNHYKQFQEPFHPGLSIIDVLMFNDKETIKKELLNYTLV